MKTEKTSIQQALRRKEELGVLLKRWFCLEERFDQKGRVLFFLKELVELEWEELL